MTLRYDAYNRLEPAKPYDDLGRGFRAEIHDPAWFLAVQWLMGEHQGENASSPIQVRYSAACNPLLPLDRNSASDPTTTPRKRSSNQKRKIGGLPVGASGSAAN